MLEILSNPFVIGILSFIAGALFVYVKSLIKQRELKNKIKSLENNIGTTMDVHRVNVEKIKALEEQVNNQRVTIETLKQKPSTQDLRELRQYAEACAMMTKKAPGFAQAWQDCLKEIAKKEEDESWGRIIFTKPVQKMINFFNRPTALVKTKEVSDIAAAESDVCKLPEEQRIDK